MNLRKAGRWKKTRLITKGIEVGHIFYFGDKYSKSMDAAVDLTRWQKRLC